MNKIEDIMNAVTSNGMREWTDERVEQAMKEYATAVAEDALKRAAENVTVLVETNVNNTKGLPYIEYVVKGVMKDLNVKVSPDKQSILSTPINTDL